MNIKNVKKGKMEKKYDVYSSKFREPGTDEDEYHKLYVQEELRKGHTGNHGIVWIGISPTYQTDKKPYILYDGGKIIGRYKTGDDAADARYELYGF